MTDDQLWTVARFPDGSWSTGGKPSDPAYQCCDVYTVLATDRDGAKRKAQQFRRALLKKQQPRPRP